MAGIIQNWQKCLIFIVIPSENEGLGGSKKFIRSDSEKRVFRKKKVTLLMKIRILIVINSNNSYGESYN